MEYQPPVNGDTGDPDRPYVNPVPGVSKGSIPPAEAIEHPMREIVNVIVAAGLTPDDEDLTQLEDAILAMIAANTTTTPDASTTVKGKVELTTGAEALAGTDTTRAVTAAALFSGASLSGAGYYTFPGGLMVQWGQLSINSASGNTHNFPTAFTTACYGVVCNEASVAPPSVGNISTFGVTSKTTTNFHVYALRGDDTFSSNDSGFYFAFGK